MLPSGARSGFWSRRLNSVALAVFLAIAAFFLFTEHRAHLYGALPYLLLLACVALLVILWRAWRSASPNHPAGPKQPPKSGIGGISHEP